MEDGKTEIVLLMKLILVLLVAAAVMLAVGCGRAHAADDAPAVLLPPPPPPASPAPAPAPVPPPPVKPAAPPEGDHASPVFVPGPPAGADRNGPPGEDLLAPSPAVVFPNHHRIANNLDALSGVNGMFQDQIDVPTATETWKIHGGSSLWLGYRRDIPNSRLSFGGKIGYRSFGLEQANSTTGKAYHHRIDSLFLMPNLRLTLPLGASKHLFFIDAGAGAGFHSFALDHKVPDGTPRPVVQSTFAVNVVSGFLFNVYDGDARLDLGFDLNLLTSVGDITKLYPAGSTAAAQFHHFNLGSLGLDFNIAVKF